MQVMGAICLDLIINIYKLLMVLINLMPHFLTCNFFFSSHVHNLLCDVSNVDACLEMHVKTMATLIKKQN